MRNKEELFIEIKKRATPLNSIDELCFGQMLLTGLSNGVAYDFDSAVGFVCQVRKGADVNGQDVLLLRHSTQELVCHIDQGFFVIPDELIRHALAFFKRGVEVEMIENPELDYTIGEFLNERGFIVEKGEKVNPNI